MSSKKILYIDNLKVLMTVLVILHHAFITYGASGGWYYTQPTTRMAALAPMTMFVSINQSFFMGFFFFLSALFIPASYDRKGPGRFVADRLKRLGIPLLFYSLVLSPLFIYLAEHYGRGEHGSFLDYMRGYHHWIDFGVLWFVAALLLFSLVYVLLRILRSGSQAPASLSASPDKVPSRSRVILFALILGLVTFLVRIVFPVGWTLRPLGFQLGHFPQYIALFALGIIASRRHWLEAAILGKSRFWIVTARLSAFVGFPCIYLVKIITDCPLEFFSGGWHGQALLYSLYEQFMGISIIMALLSWSKSKWNSQSSLLRNMSRSAYAVYIIHPLFLISIAVLMKGWQVDPVCKLPLLALTAIPAAFLTASLLVRLPGLKNII
jgi:hypothetical protein